MPNEIGEVTVREELMAYYKNIVRDDDYYEEYARIGTFLVKGAKNDALLQAVKVLEDTLKETLRKANRSAEDALKYLQKRQELRYTKNQHPKVCAFSHLITKALQDAETKYGFDASGKVSMLGDIVSEEAFLSMLRQRKPFKDVGALATHGEFTHRLQWFVICTARDVLRMKDNEKAWVYSKIGSYRSQSPDGRSKMALWNLLCDRLGTPIENDFRRPETFHIWLRGEDCRVRFPILHAFLKDRVHKREPPNLAEYMKRKTGLSLKEINELQSKEQSMFVYDQNKQMYVPALA